MFEFVEEALDCITLAVDPGTEREGFDTVRHGADVGPCAPFGHCGAQDIAIISAVGEQDVPGLLSVARSFVNHSRMSLNSGLLFSWRTASRSCALKPLIRRSISNNAS